MSSVAVPEGDNSMLLTVPQVAERLHVSRWTIYQLIHRNKLKTIKLGSARRVPLTAVTECLEHLQETGGTDL
jgi:excisionase family DNA binding protein